MTTNRRELETQLVRIQSEFLNNPAASLSMEQARNRCSVDEMTCQAILDVLVDTGVVARMSTGSYARYFPTLHRQSAA